jgi:hypothetical protein
MPEKHELREKDLKCLDCLREFRGLAWWTVHYVANQDEPVGETFDRVETKCPVSPFHRVTLRDA